MVAPCAWITSSVCVLMGSSFSEFGGHEIDQGENEHPHQVDKVPVEPGDFHILGLEFAAHHSLADDRKVNQPDDHVGHMQAGERKECAAEQRYAPGSIENGHVFVID